MRFGYLHAEIDRFDCLIKLCKASAVLKRDKTFMHGRTDKVSFYCSLSLRRCVVRAPLTGVVFQMQSFICKL